jgi:hypothetical protein
MAPARRTADGEQPCHAAWRERPHVANEWLISPLPTHSEGVVVAVYSNGALCGMFSQILTAARIDGARRAKLTVEQPKWATPEF